MLTDAATEAKLVPATFASATCGQLERLSPRLAKNPVDVGPQMSLRDDPFTIYEEVVPLVLSDPNVDCLTIVCHFGQPIVKVLTGLAPQISRIGKPVTIFGYGIDLPDMQKSAREIEAMGLPAYLDLETAVKALAVGAAYSRIRARLAEGTQ